MEGIASSWVQGPERAQHFWRMTTSWTEGGQWRATGRAAEQAKEPEAHFLLHSEPLENFNQEGDTARTSC